MSQPAQRREFPWMAALRALVPRLRLVTVGVRALVRYQGQVVLVRHRFHDRGRWYLPGGGVDAREDSATAALREVEEETGIPRVNLTLQACSGAFLNQLSGWDDHVLLFVIDASAPPLTLPLSLEILECRAFDWAALPELSPGTERRLQELRERTDGPPRSGAW